MISVQKHIFCYKPSNVFWRFWLFWIFFHTLHILVEKFRYLHRHVIFHEHSERDKKVVVKCHSRGFFLHFKASVWDTDFTNFSMECIEHQFVKTAPDGWLLIWLLLFVLFFHSLKTVWSKIVIQLFFWRFHKYFFPTAVVRYSMKIL
jgi:hypothetical protein